MCMRLREKTTDLTIGTFWIPWPVRSIYIYKVKPSIGKRHGGVTKQPLTSKDCQRMAVRMF